VANMFAAAFATSCGVSQTTTLIDMTRFLWHEDNAMRCFNDVAFFHWTVP
jgi:hypothetical protein